MEGIEILQGPTKIRKINYYRLLWLQTQLVAIILRNTVDLCF